MLRQSFMTIKQELFSPLTWSRYRGFCEKVSPQEKLEVFDTKTEKKSLLQQILPDRSLGIDTVAYLHKKGAFSVDDFVNRTKNAFLKRDTEAQEYKAARHNTLGANLASAHFLLGLGAAIKLSNSPGWIKKDKKKGFGLPSKFVPNLYVEQIDASNTEIMYEGFANLVHLFHLKSLSFRNCPNVDDWCLDRLHIFSGTSLEHLDISSCPQITERGLCSLHKLRNLKSLVIEDLPNVKHKELICFMIEDYFPNINITYEKQNTELAT